MKPAGVKAIKEELKLRLGGAYRAMSKFIKVQKRK